MPYRRLPNTDAGRIRAMQMALTELCAGNEADVKISTHTVQAMLAEFVRLHSHYNEAHRLQVQKSKSLQRLFRDTKMYVSHFIQVLNLAVIRKEIKAELKPLYGLDIAAYNVPEMLTAEQVLEWGERIVSGENLRKIQGGTPLYNPSIARVEVLVSQFKDALFTQRKSQEDTHRHQERLKEKRAAVDHLLQDMWNKIEQHFSHLPEAERLSACKQWGIVYYLRKNERETSQE